jgi:predicted aconitase
MGTTLIKQDLHMLSGESGEADRFAMSVITRMAKAVGASRLISIEQAHLDACALMSDSSLEFIQHIVENGGRVRVPTTLNMVSLDLDAWRTLGVPEDFGDKATRIAEAYKRLGAVPTWTCAPYQVFSSPRFGQQIAWGESNAVAYANSVLGARTNRYGDYMDVCAAITGRVPYYGLHCEAERAATYLVKVEGVNPGAWSHTASWATLGHLLGQEIGSGIPAVEGLPRAVVSDQLKALLAAAASSGGIALCHLVGITPEAPSAKAALHGKRPERTIRVGPEELRASWEDLSSASEGDPVDAVILGCPHSSYHEFETMIQFVDAMEGASVSSHVQLLVISNAPMVALARRNGWIEKLQAFGATLVHDTCPFHSPIVARDARTIATNSGKCAYYAPGELGVQVAFGTTRECLLAAVRGQVVREEIQWSM